MPMTEKQIEAVLDRAGIGHARGYTLRKGAWWVTAGSVHIVPVAHAFERATRAEVEPLVRHLLSAHDDHNSTLRDDRVTHAADQLRAWLNKEAPHGTPA